jgi:multidrug efflux pump subunit AcrA (membrane-fusion protein)
MTILMKLPAFSLLRFAVVGATLLFGALVFFPAPLRAAEKQLYTCGMHPQIVRDKPGNCPICGMKLQPVRANTAGGAKASAPAGERKVKYYKSTMIPGQISQTPAKDTMGMDMVPVYEGEDASAESDIQIDAATTQRMNLKTALVGRGPVKRDFRTVGTVAYNEEGLRDITTKYEGWLEKLHVNATWTVVKAGDPLFDIYSPDLYNAQLNYLVATRSEGAAGGALTRAALARLQLFDLPEEFIAEVARTGEARRTYTFRAPVDGVVIEKMAVAGQMMKAGEKIYRLADLSTVWVHAQIYEKDLPFVRESQPAEVRTSYGQQRSFAGTVRLLLPQVEEQTRAATARIVLPNPDRYLRPGMFTDVRFTTQLTESAVLVPDMAVLRSGERNRVFIAKDGGSFEPREVQLGARSEGNFYEVLSGLTVGDRIVTSGQFMLDSESQLREAIQKMLKSAEGTPTANAAATPPASAPADGRKVLRYQSSMMPVETSPTPAKDSMGMEMVPVYEEPAPASAPAAHQHEAPAPAPRKDGPPEPADPGSPSAGTMLKPLAFGLADAAAALAADDLAGYRQQLPALRAALAAYFAADAHSAHGPLGKFKDGFPESADLKSAREEFTPLSTALADLARAAHLHHTEGLHIFECEMAPGGTGRWLQRTADLKNPFLGSAMSGCGTEIDAPPQQPTDHPGHGGGMAAMLPPGHPPIDTGSISDYLLAQTAPSASAKQGNGDACGSCGMSAAEMAAGEPCEHDKK